VHAFLEHWGILNYEVDNETRPVAVPPPPVHFAPRLHTPAHPPPGQVNSVPSATAGRIILTDGPNGLEEMIQKTQSGSVATVVSFDDRWLNKAGPLDLCLRRNIFHNPQDPFIGEKAPVDDAC
jgi:hypothetical protein